MKIAFKDLNLNKRTRWETTEPDKDGNVYVIRCDTFKGPMWLFHLLRRLAIFFDRLANKTRSLIFKLENHYEADFQWNHPK